ncbi:MAG: prolipoprotein diacylglyceryl transferase [Chloroflexota bacterium]|nr:prolipoprotein diacylglyceryl transferase [Chloroflexota bacterium]MBI5701988.1 prolipoprotein diacylglyceryl transferase [Chloroflexota bacterium]
MFPYLRLGPFILPMASLALLAGFWAGLSVIEREAARLKINVSALSNTIFYSLLAGLIGARLGYALEFPAVYSSNPLSLLALTPTTLSPSAGLVVGLIVFAIFVQRKAMPIRPTLDAIAPGLALFMVFVGFAHLLSGDAYGAPTSVPWAIRLWNEYRHPSQFYETFIALTIFLVICERLPKPAGAGLNFLLTVALSSASRVFLEAFRGDSIFLPGGFREAQVVALVVMAISFYWMRRWMYSGLEENTSDLTVSNGTLKNADKRR